MIVLVAIQALFRSVPLKIMTWLLPLNTTTTSTYYASKAVIDILISCVDIFLELMHTSFHKPGLMKIIRERIVDDDNLDCLGCSEHAQEVQRLVILYFSRVSIYHRRRVVNTEYAKKDNWWGEGDEDQVRRSSSCTPKRTQEPRDFRKAF